MGRTTTLKALKERRESYTTPLVDLHHLYLPNHPLSYLVKGKGKKALTEEGVVLSQFRYNIRPAEALLGIGKV